jgi:hypothetical protein
MKPVKVVIAVLGVVGLLAVFVLPYISMGSESMSFWKLVGLVDRKIQAYLAVVGFGLATVAGVLAIAKGGLARLHGILALVGFALCFAAGGVREGIKSETAIGGKLLFAAALLGIIVAIVGIAKPEKS